MENIVEEAKAANIHLHILTNGRVGSLTVDRIIQEVAQWRNASVWLYDQSGLGAALRTGFSNKGLPIDKRVHQ